MIGTVQCLGDARFCVSTVPRIDNRCGRDFQTTNCIDFTNLASAFNFYELDLQLNYEPLTRRSQFYEFGSSSSTRPEVVAKLMSLINDRATREKLSKIINKIIINIYFV